LNQKAVRILLLDNIDSFTYNIYHYLEALGAEVTVIDHTIIEPELLQSFDGLVISPGPGLPKEAGKLMEILHKAVTLKLPTLGVCLGMQAIAEYFGGRIYNQHKVKHGQFVMMKHTGSSVLFRDMPEQFQVGLYHSWAVEEALPSVLVATAFSEDGVMMALEHRSLPVYGVQFHPESILSEYGKELFQNFLGRIQ
jgi:anthranilate synthase component 2